MGRMEGSIGGFLVKAMVEKFEKWVKSHLTFLSRIVDNTRICSRSFDANKSYRRGVYKN